MQVTFYSQNNNLDINTYSLGGVMVYLTRISISFLVFETRSYYTDYTVLEHDLPEPLKYWGWITVMHHHIWFQYFLQDRGNISSKKHIINFLLNFTIVLPASKKGRQMLTPSNYHLNRKLSHYKFLQHCISKMQ